MRPGSKRLYNGKTKSTEQYPANREKALCFFVWKMRQGPGAGLCTLPEIAKLLDSRGGAG